MAGESGKFYMPYHLAIASTLENLKMTVRCRLFFLYIHLLRILEGKRPWSAAVLWDKDERLAKHLFGSLSKSEKLIGNNQPYSGRLKNDAYLGMGQRKVFRML